MDRQPVVAGQFYPASPASLDAEVRRCLALAAKQASELTVLAMAPHAGYVFSGPVAGQTLGQANLAGTVLLLGPNHTGRGAPMAVWPQGRWLVPGGGLNVDEPLSLALLQGASALTADHGAHEQEHSLEVLVPFLAALNLETTIVPVAVSEPRFEILEQTALAMAAVIKGRAEPVSVVVSSDMSHFETQERAKELDFLALEPALQLDPQALYETVRGNGISMCGVLPMTLGLLLAKALGATQARLSGYSTSADASGDTRRVVGYAGIVVN